MKRISITILIMILLLVLDNTLIPLTFCTFDKFLLNSIQIPMISNVYPSLLFVFVICYSIINGKWDALWIGIVSGSLQDIYFYHGFGINCLFNMLACVCAAYIGKGIFKEKVSIPVTANFGLSFGKGVLVFCTLFLLGVHSNFYSAVYSSIYNMLLAIFLYKWIYKLYQKPMMVKKWKF